VRSVICPSVVGSSTSWFGLSPEYGTAGPPSSAQPAWPWRRAALDVGCSVGGEPRFWVNWRRVDASWSNLEVKVGPGGVPVGPDVCDVLPGADTVAGLDVEAVGVHVGVAGGNLLTVDGVLDQDEVAVARGRAGERPPGHQRQRGCASRWQRRSRRRCAACRRR
jgi:hypothetical protein